ncbi:hypothetical protein K0M31_013695 [Melipona bicolor]|uniref:Uncharacterized protein n=1 Tax=Melipona bicolor TaxID=60889 RepID=A0AA40FHI7_9HYME|nr:hypothetical protein K0M31_013695 [Melipona bicolor]
MVELDEERCECDIEFAPGDVPVIDNVRPLDRKPFARSVTKFMKVSRTSRGIIGKAAACVAARRWTWLVDPCFEHRMANDTLWCILWIRSKNPWRRKTRKQACVERAKGGRGKARSKAHASWDSSSHTPLNRRGRFYSAPGYRQTSRRKETTDVGCWMHDELASRGCIHPPPSGTRFGTPFPNPTSQRQVFSYPNFPNADFALAAG